MSIQRKTVLLFSGVSLLFFLIVYLIADRILTASYLELEAKSNREKLVNLEKLLQAEKKRLETLAKDWAVWDDSYRFLNDGNHGFIESSFGDGKDINSDLETNMVFFLDRNGRVVYGEYYPFEREAVSPVEDDFVTSLMDRQTYTAFLNQKQVRSVMLVFENRILLASLHPVTDSNAQADPNGAVLFARFFDRTLLTQFSEAMSVPVTLETGEAGIAEGNRTYCNDGTCTNRLPLYYGQNSTIGYLVFETPREIYTQGRNTLFLLMTLFLIVGVLCLTLLWFFLEKSVLWRVSRLSFQVADIKIDEISPKKVSVSGNDELGRLGETINRMLAKIYDYQQEQRLVANRTRLVAMGKMVRDIAHHWRQPLTVLAAKIQNMKMDYDDDHLDDKMVDAFVTEALKQITGMSRVIDDFGRFYDTKTAEERFDLVNQFKRAAAILKPRLDDNGVQLAYDLPEVPCFLNGSPADMVHVLSGLMDNALNAILQRDSSGEGRIDITIWQEEKSVQIRVCDNGIGIDDSSKDQLFDPYFSTKQDKNGTGLGLYMAKMVIEYNMHGSLILDESRPGMTCFRLKLPVAE